MTVATPGRANFLMKQGAKLKRKKASPKRYQAKVSILKRDTKNNEEEKKDS